MKHPKIEVTPEQAVAIDFLYNATNGFQYEMYCLLNKYLFNPNHSYSLIPELEVIRGSNLFQIVDGIRYGYEVI